MGETEFPHRCFFTLLEGTHCPHHGPCIEHSEVRYLTLSGECIAAGGDLKEGLKETHSPRSYAAAIMDVPENVINIQFDQASKIATALIIPSRLRVRHYQRGYPRRHGPCAICAEITIPPEYSYDCETCLNIKDPKLHKICKPCFTHLTEIGTCFNCWLDRKHEQQDKSQLMHPRRFELVYTAAKIHADRLEAAHSALQSTLAPPLLPAPFYDFQVFAIPKKNRNAEMEEVD